MTDKGLVGCVFQRGHTSMGSITVKPKFLKHISDGETWWWAGWAIHGVLAGRDCGKFLELLSDLSKDEHFTQL